MAVPTNGQEPRDDPNVRVDEALHSISMSIPALFAASHDFPENFVREHLQTVAYHLNAIGFMLKIIETYIEKANDDTKLKTIAYFSEIEKSNLIKPIKQLLTPALAAIKKRALVKAKAQTA